MEANIATSMYPATTEIDLHDDHPPSMENGSDKSASKKVVY